MINSRDIYKLIPRKYVKSTEYIFKGIILPKLYPEDKTSVKVFANSYPKAGTNLLKSFFEHNPKFNNKLIYHIDPGILNNFFSSLLNNQNKGQVLTSHMPYSDYLSNLLFQKKVKNIFIIRDVRDILVSNYKYLTYKDKYHRLHKYFNSLKSDNERLRVLIEGIDIETGVSKKKETIGEYSERFLGWFKDKTCLVVKFEELIGDAGGGSDQLRNETIDKILDYLSVNLSKSAIVSLRKSLFSPNAKTFRKGQIGDWKNHFNEENKKIFKIHAGQLLLDMGYEKDFNW